MKQSPQLTQALAQIKPYAAPVMKHFYLLFILILVMGAGVCLYFIANTFGATDEAYRTEKEKEFMKDVRIVRNDETVDRVLQLQTANTGPVVPDYDPDRDNPFVE